MSVTLPAQEDAAKPAAAIRQLTVGGVLGVWAAAAVPMGVLAWVAAPVLARVLSGPHPVPLVKALTICLSVGLIWQFALVLILTRREQQRLQWVRLREALWLKPPRSPHSGRVGGRLWLVVIPLIILYFAEGLLPTLPLPDDRNLGLFLSSQIGQNFFAGAWGWFALTLVMMVFNTALGEELLFRGYLLPRMTSAFGRGDWVANGVLFAAYHVHTPWVMPTALLDALLLSYPTKRYRSAWIGILVHSSQTLFFGVVLLLLVW